MRAYNPAGVTDSKILGVVFAALPDAPPVPTKVLDHSSSTYLTVDISDFPQISNGGCEIITFDIQMDDGLGGSFISKVGQINPNLALHYQANSLVKGRTYRFRYRA